MLFTSCSLTLGTQGKNPVSSGRRAIGPGGFDFDLIIVWLLRLYLKVIDFDSYLIHINKEDNTCTLLFNFLEYLSK